MNKVQSLLNILGETKPKKEPSFEELVKDLTSNLQDYQNDGEKITNKSIRAYVMDSGWYDDQPTMRMKLIRAIQNNF